MTDDDKFTIHYIHYLVPNIGQLTNVTKFYPSHRLLKTGSNHTACFSDELILVRHVEETLRPQLCPAPSRTLVVFITGHERPLQNKESTVIFDRRICKAVAGSHRM